MFQIYPGFEDLPMRIEVQWQEQKRVIISRVERWPESDQAVIICTLEDDESSKWLITGYHPNPTKQLWNNVTFDILTRKAIANWQWKTKRLNKLRALLQRAFKGQNFHPLRLFYLPDLPAEPRVICRRLGCYSHGSLCWMMEEPFYNPNNREFKMSSTYWSLTERKEFTNDQLLAEWNNPQSDARFAWQLSSLPKEEKLRLITGYDGDTGDLR